MEKHLRSCWVRKVVCAILAILAFEGWSGIWYLTLSTVLAVNNAVWYISMSYAKGDHCTHAPFPSATEFTGSIPPGTKWFVKLDAKNGYFQLLMDEATMALTTFVVSQGWFQYCRAPMGLCSSGDEYCACGNAALCDIQGIKKIIDDILIHAKSIPELLDTVRWVVEWCREHQITLSKEKVQMGNTITFAGYILSDQGVCVDPDKLKAIRDFPEPTNITKLWSFLDLATQLGHFLPDLAHVFLTTPDTTQTSMSHGYGYQNTLLPWPRQKQPFSSLQKHITSTPRRRAIYSQMHHVDMV